MNRDTMPLRAYTASAQHAQRLARAGALEVVTLGDRRVRLRLEDPAHAKTLEHLPLDGLMNLEDLLFDMFEEEDDEALMLLTATDVESTHLVGIAHTGPCLLRLAVGGLQNHGTAAARRNSGLPVGFLDIRKSSVDKVLAGIHDAVHWRWHFLICSRHEVDA